MKPGLCPFGSRDATYLISATLHTSTNNPTEFLKNAKPARYLVTHLCSYSTRFARFARSAILHTCVSTCASISTCTVIAYLHRICCNVLSCASNLQLKLIQTIRRHSKSLSNMFMFHAFGFLRNPFFRIIY